MDIIELLAYHDQKEKEYKVYLDTELQKFKDVNNEYLSARISEGCEHAKNLFETSNKKAFELFDKSKEEIEGFKKEGYSTSLIDSISKSAKKELDDYLKGNKNMFEQSIAYYKDLL